MKTAIKLNTLIYIALLFGLQGNAYAKVNNHTLSGLIEAALGYHPSIKSSISLQSAAKQEIDAAEWQYFPTPSLSVSRVDASNTDSSFSGDSRIIKLGLTQPLWSGGSLAANLERAQAQLEINKSESLVVKRDLTLGLINSYSIWLSSYLKLKSYQSSQAEHQLLQKRIERRIKQGLSSGSDLAFVNSRLSQVGANLNSARIRHENAVLQLQESVGERLNIKSLRANISTDYPIQGELQSLLTRALIIDPKLIKLRATIKSLSATYKANKAALQPTVNLKVERQWGNFNTKDAKTENRVFIDVVSRFGAGLSNFSKIKQTKLEMQASEFEIESVRNSLERQFEGDWLSVKSLIKQKKILKNALISSKKIQKSWYRQYLAGRKQWTDVMNSIREVAQLESQLADTMAESLLITWRLGVRVDGVLKLAYYNQSLKPLVKVSDEKLLNNNLPIVISKQVKAAPNKPKHKVEKKRITTIKKVELVTKDGKKIEPAKKSIVTKIEKILPVVVKKVKVINPKDITAKVNLKLDKDSVHRAVWRSKQNYQFQPQSLDLSVKPLKEKVVKPITVIKLPPLPKVKVSTNTQKTGNKKANNEKSQRKVFWNRRY